MNPTPVPELKPGDPAPYLIKDIWRKVKVKGHVEAVTGRYQELRQETP